MRASPSSRDPIPSVPVLSALPQPSTGLPWFDPEGSGAAAGAPPVPLSFSSIQRDQEQQQDQDQPRCDGCRAAMDRLLKLRPQDTSPENAVPCPVRSSPRSSASSLSSHLSLTISLSLSLSTKSCAAMTSLKQLRRSLTMLAYQSPRDAPATFPSDALIPPATNPAGARCQVALPHQQLHPRPRHGNRAISVSICSFVRPAPWYGSSSAKPILYRSWSARSVSPYESGVRIQAPLFLHLFCLSFRLA